MSEIEDLRKQVISLREERDWAQFHNPKDSAISLALESAEFLELFQWKDSAEIAAFLANHKHRAAEELADVFYWLLLISYDLDIDLNQSFLAKLEEIKDKYPVEKARGNHKKYSEL